MPKPRAEVEDPPHDVGLGVVDLPSDVPAGPARARHRHVVVAEDAAARDVARLRFPAQGVVGALSGLLAFELVGERGQREHDLVGGGIERPLPILEVEEHPHAAGDQLLQRVGCLDGLAAEP
jgi:hypothetical protein